MTPRLLAKIGVVGFSIGSTIALVQYFTARPCVPMQDVPWAPARLDEIGASTARAGKADAWPPTRAAIESFGRRWDAASVRACELPDEAVRETAYACLAASLSRMTTSLEALRLLDPEALSTAEATMVGLPDPDACLPH